MKKIILILNLLLGLLGLLQAQNPGDLDLSFNGTGFNVFVDTAESRYYKALLLPDGRIVAGGVMQDSVDSWLVIDRYLDNGQHDLSFDGDGRFVLTTMDASPTEHFVMELQPDGKTVFAAEVNYFGVMYIMVMRLELDGSPDTTFGQGGYVLDPANTYWNRPLDMDIRPSGQILLLGAGEDAFSMVALLPNGNRDNSFGIQSGMAWNLWTGMQDFDVLAGQITPDGSGYVLLEEQTWTPRHVVAALKSDCQFDSSFGLNGLQILPQSHLAGGPIAMEVTSTKEIYLTGAPGGSPGNFLEVGLIRLRPNGSLDTGYGTNGIVRFADPGADLYSLDLSVQIDGKVVFAGSSEGSSYDILAGRATIDGHVDTTFGQGGISSPYMSGAYSGGVAMAQQADGKIIVVGERVPNQNRYGLIARLDGGVVLAGVEGPRAEAQVVAYPNPASGEVKLLVKEWSGDAQVTVMDMSGRAMIHANWPANELSGLQLHLTDLPNGTYMVQVVGEDRVATERLVVLHP